MIKSILEFKKLQEEIPEIIAQSQYKTAHFVKELDIPQSTFYRKAKSGKFTADEMLKIYELIYPKEYYRWEYEQEIKQARKEIATGKGVSNTVATDIIRSKIKN